MPLAIRWTLTRPSNKGKRNDTATPQSTVSEGKYSDKSDTKQGNRERINKDYHKSSVANHIDNLAKKLGTKAKTTVYLSFNELPADIKKYIHECER